ncbi:DVU_1556 family methyltransferase [Geobacter sp.]|uniref:DVU_1556 family methyltransferase n=1 Tax=Geobacter sp. TaxID=46610 RepID=UPI0026149292|nr:class I SAM-dependent methyltransferase [Geobacter sp.]
MDAFEYESVVLRAVTGPTIRPGGLTLTDRAVGFCSFPPGARLLDVGCGAGATVEHLRSRYGFAAGGVDISRRLIAEALVRNPALPLAEGRAEALPVEGESLDGIFCECVLSIVEEPHGALAEFRRALRSGGFLVLSDMYDREASARGELEKRLSESGFSILLREDHTPLLRELAARLVLTHGSLEGVWCNAGGCVAGARSGYYLLIARKD